MIRPDLRLVGPITRIDLAIARRQTSGQARITTASPRVPPAADFSRLSRIAEINDDVDLMIVRMGRVEIRLAGRHMDELAIDEPQAMGTLRIGARCVEKREPQVLQRSGPANAFDIRNIQHPESRRLFSFCIGLIRHHEQVASQSERIAPGRVRARRRKLGHDRRTLRMRDVDDAETRARTFVRQIQKSTAVRQLLDCQPLPAVAMSIEIRMTDQLHILRIYAWLRENGRADDRADCHRADGRRRSEIAERRELETSVPAIHQRAWTRAF